MKNGQDYFLFKKSMHAPKEVTFIIITQIRAKRESFLLAKNQNWKKKSLMYWKSENKRLISRFGCKISKTFFSKGRACEKKKYFINYNKKMRWKSSFSWSESHLKNKSLKYARFKKIMFEVAFWIEKLKINFFTKCKLAPQEEKKFLVTTRRSTKERSFR